VNISYNPDDPADLWENITPVSPAEFLADAGLFPPGPGNPLWWLSFCDPDLPEGSQFLGAAIVQAPTLAAAITRSHVAGCNPGGEVQVAGPLAVDSIGPEWRDRLLTKDEALSIPEPQP
jgi:hypothetical protein